MTKNASIFLQRCILDRVFSSKITNMTYMYFLIRYNFVIFIVICLFYFFYIALMLVIIPPIVNCVTCCSKTCDTLGKLFPFIKSLSLVLTVILLYRGIWSKGSGAQ